MAHLLVSKTQAAFQDIQDVDNAAPTEQSPLLRTVDPIPDPSLTADPCDHPPESPPFPLGQIIILCTVRTTEPIIFSSIFPYIAQMVADNGHLPPSDVGFWSGLMESILSPTQILTLLLWGRMADKLGRKPAMVTSLIGMAICPMLFGMSKSLTEMIVYRCLAGCFTGSTLVVRTMIAELSTSETQARAFSYFAVAGNIGIFLGPMLGGALVDPAGQYPSLFGNNEFFKKHPYSLPGFVTGAVCLLCALANLIYVKETLQKKPSPGNTISNAPSEQSSFWSLLKARNVGLVLYVYTHVMGLAFAFTALLPVYLYTPSLLGGLGLKNFQISIYIAAQGASQAVWLLLIFPPLHRRMGTKKLMLACGAAYPFFFLGYPLLNMLLRISTPATNVLFWILAPLVACVGPGVSMSFTGAQLLLNDVSPSPKVLGTLNALALTVSSAIRTFIPGGTTALFAIGVRGDILWGQMIWAILIPIAATTWFVCKSIPLNFREDEDEN